MINKYPWLSSLLDRCTHSKVIRPAGHLVLVIFYRFIYSLHYKIVYFNERLKRKNTFTILCYPQCPNSLYVLYKCAHLLGCRITGNPNLAYDIVVRFEDTTHACIDTVLSRLAEQTRVFNIGCTDISKTRVDAVFAEVFGYSAMIDPLTYTGPCVMKSDMNGLHNGRIITCPIEAVTPGYVYQRIIDTQIDGLVQDIRVPIIGETIPFVYLKYRSADDRFSNTNNRVEIAEPYDVFSYQEMQYLMQFCRKIGLDYGELDTLRDRNDGSLYVVDVNNTPYGPPNHLPAREKRRALSMLASTFEQVFSFQTKMLEKEQVS